MSSWPLGVQKEEKVLRSEVDSWEQENKSCLKDHSKLLPKGLIYAWPEHLANKTGSKMAVSGCFLELGRAAKPTGEMDVRRYYRWSLTGGANPLCRWEREQGEREGQSTSRVWGQGKQPGKEIMGPSLSESQKLNSKHVWWKWRALICKCCHEERQIVLPTPMTKYRQISTSEVAGEWM